jgi:hypothetical protein
MFSVIKILYLILFYLIYRITDLVLLAVMLIQMGLSIFSGEPSDSIKGFGKSLGVYLQQISEFLSYASEEKPFPFSDWPDVGVFQSELSKPDTDTVVQEDSVSEKN